MIFDVKSQGPRTFLSQACEKNKFINNNNYEFEIVRSFASLQRAIVVAVLLITINPLPL